MMPSARDEAQATTLDSICDRAVAETRKGLMDRLDDDVIGYLGKSHMIFGKACAVAAIQGLIGEYQARKPDRDSAYDAGYNQGLADAAGVAEAMPCGRPVGAGDGDTYILSPVSGRVIATAIRALGAAGEKVDG